jgi:hypothetical protein
MFGLCSILEFEYSRSVKLRSSDFRLQFDDILPAAIARNGFPAVAIFGPVTAPEPDDYAPWGQQTTKRCSSEGANGRDKAFRLDVKGMLLWVGCIAGALEDYQYVAKLARARFDAIEIEPTRVYDIEDVRAFLNEQVDVDVIAPEAATDISVSLACSSNSRFGCGRCGTLR